MKCHDFETDRNVVKSCLRRSDSSWLPIQDGNYVLWTARLAPIARAKIAWTKNVHARRAAHLSRVGGNHRIPLTTSVWPGSRAVVDTMGRVGGFAIWRRAVPSVDRVAVEALARESVVAWSRFVV